VSSAPAAAAAVAPMASDSWAGQGEPVSSAAVGWYAPPRAAPDGVTAGAPTDREGAGPTARPLGGAGTESGAGREVDAGADAAPDRAVGFGADDREAGREAAVVAEREVDLDFGDFGGFGVPGGFADFDLRAACADAFPEAFPDAFALFEAATAGGSGLDVAEIVSDVAGLARFVALTVVDSSRPFGASRLKPPMFCPRGRPGLSFL
jgi:hypothetical protein